VVSHIPVPAVDRDAAEHGRCRERLGDPRRHSVPRHRTGPIGYEFLRVATHPRVSRRPIPMSGAWSFIEACLESPALTPLVPGPHHAAAADQTFRDAPHA
jgi:hypothetical protein